MNNVSLKRNILRAIISTGLLLAAATSAIAADQPIHVRGTVLDVSSTGFTVQTTAGTQTIVLSPKTKITGVIPSTLGAIKEGTYIGTANVPHGNDARALEVVVFPDAMKGTGIGDRAWDLPADNGVGSAMTNGSVTSSAMTNGSVEKMQSGAGAMSAMTNGSVQKTTGTDSRKLVVNYGSGQKTIIVGANTPIVTFAPADKTAIVKGAHVFVVGASGTPVNAGLVAVGLNGTVPPM